MPVPSPGESISEVEIAQWLVKDGDYVEKDQTIAEVDSDMSNSTINFEYYFQPWTNNFAGTPGYNNKNAYNAISTFIVLKSDQQIDAASVSN